MITQTRTGEAVASSGGTYAKALDVCAFKCRLAQVRIFNKGAASVYIQVHDSSGAPSDMTTLRDVITCDSDLYAGAGYGGGLPLTNGCYLYASEDADALSAIAGDDCHFMAVYSQERH